MTPLDNVRYLLLQARNADDPMKGQEVRCFMRALQCRIEQIQTLDLLAAAVTARELAAADVVLLGGSGHYGATGEMPWLHRAFDGLRLIHQRSQPTFASCWGFQAMARALGGRVINDPANAELGTHELTLTEAGKRDALFGELDGKLFGQMGHEDRVVELPPDAELLASTAKVQNQAYRFRDKPIYCTQFHAELNRDNLLERVQAYPNYIQKVAGMTFERFAEVSRDTPETEALLRRFVKQSLNL